MATIERSVSEGDFLNETVSIEDFGFIRATVFDFIITDVSYSGDAILGTDYSLTTNASDGSADITLTAFEDFMEENDETATISVSGFIEYIDAPAENAQFYTNLDGQLVFGTLRIEEFSETVNVTIQDAEPLCDVEPLLKQLADAEVQKLANLEAIQLEQTKINEISARLTEIQLLTKDAAALNLFIGTSKIFLAFFDRLGVGELSSYITEIATAQTELGALNNSREMQLILEQQKDLIEWAALQTPGGGAKGVGDLARGIDRIEGFTEADKKARELADIIKVYQDAIERGSQEEQRLLANISELQTRNAEIEREIDGLRQQIEDCDDGDGGPGDPPTLLSSTENLSTQESFQFDAFIFEDVLL